MNNELLEQELSLNELEDVNGGLLGLLIAALLPSPANAPAPGDDIYTKPGLIEVVTTGSTLGNPDGRAPGVWAGEDGKGCTDRGLPF